jgi:hypothetical protein
MGLFRDRIAGGCTGYWVQIWIEVGVDLRGGRGLGVRGVLWGWGGRGILEWGWGLCSGRVVGVRAEGNTRRPFAWESKESTVSG